MKFYTTEAKEREGSANCVYVYYFGPPHHGKVPWDGFGGTLKRKVYQDCSSALATLEPLPYTLSGFVEDTRDAYDVMRHHFESPERRDRRASRNSVDQWHLFLYTFGQNPVHRPEEKFKRIVDISYQYQLLMRRAGVVYISLRVCWCLPCVASLWNGFNDWLGDEHVFPDCVMLSAEEDASEEEEEEASPSEELEEDEEDEEEDLKFFTFYQGNIAKKSGEVSTGYVSIPRNKSKEIASGLELGMWVLYDSKKSLQPIWLGRMLSNPDWAGKYSWVNDTSRWRKHLFTTIKPGQVGPYIQWYEKTNVNSTTTCFEIPSLNSGEAVGSELYYFDFVWF